MQKTLIRSVTFLALAGLTGCASTPGPESLPIPTGDDAALDTAEDITPDRAAAAFVDSAETVLLELAEKAGRAQWVQNTYITYDTEILAAEATEAYLAASVDLAMRAAEYLDAPGLDPVVGRKLQMLVSGLTMPAPADPEKTAAVTRIQTEMESRYARGEYCSDGECWDLGEMSQVMATSRDEPLLRELWAGWREVSVPMRESYTRFVELGNQGASELGFDDVGAMWRANYDMEPDAFAAELDRLYRQTLPLYTALHCHVRAELAEEYGDDVVPTDGPIPAHLLGNMWAQSWANIYPLVAPPASDPGYDLTERLQAEGYNALEMVRTGERFFTSLGFDPLPETFWERSLFTQPADRDVVCHASAWDVDNEDDLRIKMCINVNAEDFQTIHHELGHNFYQRAYKSQPFLFRNSANDGFHEALGDAVALSVTPAYLREIGLIDRVPPAEADLGLLMRDALDKIAFLPFGLLVDQWRWRVFSGEIPANAYNRGWWELRERYQGVTAPVERTEADFDPGAKYHVPANVPYTRYFLAGILQFQFHRALCEQAGATGPLNRCSIYGNAKAGESLRQMMELGSARPWQEALETMTGSPEMDARAVLDYFAPLKEWLDEQNRGRTCGW